MHTIKLAFRNNVRILPAIATLFVSIILAVILQAPTEFNHAILTIAITFCYALNIYNWRQSGNSILSIYCLFLIYAFLSNAGQCILYMFHAPSILLSIYRNFGLDSVCLMLRFHLLCAAGLLLGGAIGCSQIIDNEVTVVDIQHSLRERKEDSQYELIFTVIMFISYFMMLGFAIYQIQQRQVLAYSDYYNMEDKQRMPEQANLLAVALGVRTIFRKKYVKTTYAFWLVYVLLFFIAGTRSTAIVYVAAIIAMLPKSYPELFKKKFAVLWIVVILFFFGLISVTSSFRTGSLVSGAFSANSTGFWANIVNTISEMGGAARPTIYTMRWIDSGGEHYQTLIYTILHGIVPTEVLNWFGSSWSTQLGRWINEYAGAIGTQYGYSFIAEMYMNYGWFGFIFLIFYSWLIVYGERKAYSMGVRGNSFFAGVVIALLGRQVFFARANLSLILSFYRNSIYLAIGWFVIKRFVLHRHRRTSI
jgi:hypothetical protein